MAVRRSIRQKTKAPKKSKAHHHWWDRFSLKWLVQWITHGVEFLMVFFSLFWAVEANAQKKVWQPRWMQVQDANVRSPAAHLEANHLSSKMIKELHRESIAAPPSAEAAFSNLRKYQTASTLIQGDSLSPTFKQGTWYVPTLITLIRF